MAIKKRPPWAKNDLPKLGGAQHCAKDKRPSERIIETYGPAPPRQRMVAGDTEPSSIC
jgi:hypothetical protein